VCAISTVKNDEDFYIVWTEIMAVIKWKNVVLLLKTCYHRDCMICLVLNFGFDIQFFHVKYVVLKLFTQNKHCSHF
jgi:hypothetical protein